MIEEQKFDKVLSYFIIFLISCIMLFTIFMVSNKYRKALQTINELNEEIEYYKNNANPSEEIIDSLVYNITYRDTIIYNYKKEYIKDVEVIQTMPDSAVVDLFNKLVWAE